MSKQPDIISKTRSATEVAVFETESENHPAQASACDYADLIHHHNERAKARQQKQPEPAAEPDYEVEGMRPHN